jgi:hypothetical protein
MLLVVALGATGCASLPRRGPACSADLAAEERAVRAMSAGYATVRDVDAEMAEFTDDVWFYSPLRPQPTVGRAARRAVIAGAPGDCSRGPHHPRDDGSDDGSVRRPRGGARPLVTRWTTPTGPDSTVGYYLMTYRKVNGAWRIAAASVHRGG